MGRTVVGLAGGGGAGGAGVLTLFGAYNPRPGSRWWRVVACGLVVTVRGGEIDTVGRGRGALPAVACDSWWWCGLGLRLLVVALLPLGAWRGAGGLALSSWWWVGLVVTISLGSVRGGGVGVGFWCGQ